MTHNIFMCFGGAGLWGVDSLRHARSFPKQGRDADNDNSGQPGKLVHLPDALSPLVVVNSIINQKRSTLFKCVTPTLVLLYTDVCRTGNSAVQTLQPFSGCVSNGFAARKSPLSVYALTVRCASTADTRSPSCSWTCYQWHTGTPTNSYGSGF